MKTHSPFFAFMKKSGCFLNLFRYFLVLQMKTNLRNNENTSVSITMEKENKARQQRNLRRKNVPTCYVTPVACWATAMMRKMPYKTCCCTSVNAFPKRRHTIRNIICSEACTTFVPTVCVGNHVRYYRQNKWKTFTKNLLRTKKRHCNAYNTYYLQYLPNRRKSSGFVFMLIKVFRKSAHGSTYPFLR